MAPKGSDIKPGVRSPRVFFGWWTVVTGGLLALWAEGYFSYGFSALFKPISSELGFSRAVTSVATSIIRLEGAIEAPLAGWITDRFGPRWIVVAGVATMSLGLVLMNYIDSLWSFYLAWGVVFGSGFMLSVHLPMDTAISNWFVRKRGTALSVRMAFSGMSGVLVMPLVAWLITVQGWRMTCVIGGLVLAVVFLPMAWLSLRTHRPEYYGLLPDGAAVRDETVADARHMIDRGVEYAGALEEVEFTLREAMKTPAYWLLLVSQGIHALAASAINVHCIPFLTDMDIDSLKAAGMMAMMVAASIPLRPVTGYLADRLSRGNLRVLVAAAYLLQTGGLAVFLLNQTVPAVYAWFVLYGMGMGMGWTVASPVRARYFGRKAFGSIGGSSMLFVTPLAVAAPVYLGWVYDTSSSYTVGFTVLAVLLAAATVLALFIVPPKRPGRASDIRRII